MTAILHRDPETTIAELERLLGIQSPRSRPKRRRTMSGSPEGDAVI